MPACQQPAALCSQQGRACACAAMQLLAAMQLRGSSCMAAQAQARPCWECMGEAAGAADNP